MFAGAVFDDSADLFKDAVAGKVTPGIIDFLEVVEVQKQKTQGMLLARCACHLLLQGTIEMPLIIEGRQIVLYREKNRT